MIILLYEKIPVKIIFQQQLIVKIWVYRTKNPYFLDNAKYFFCTLTISEVGGEDGEMRDIGITG